MTQNSPESSTFAPAQPLAEAIHGYSAETANNDDINQVTVAPNPPQGGLDDPSSGQASSSTSLSNNCACIVCLGIGISDSNPYDDPLDPYDPRHCRFSRCSWGEISYCNVRTEWSPGFSFYGMEIARARHEKTHYRRGPEDSGTPFSCPVENCHFSSKRWSDLHRHTAAKHCDNPAKFACSVIGCKFNGEGNGFTRKDKLTAHCKSMHQGQRVLGQAERAIRPAPASSHGEASGSSAIGA